MWLQDRDWLPTVMACDSMDAPIRIATERIQRQLLNIIHVFEQLPALDTNEAVMKYMNMEEEGLE